MYIVISYMSVLFLHCLPKALMPLVFSEAGLKMATYKNSNCTEVLPNLEF